MKNKLFVLVDAVSPADRKPRFLTRLGCAFHPSTYLPDGSAGQPRPDNRWAVSFCQGSGRTYLLPSFRTPPPPLAPPAADDRAGEVAFGSLEDVA
jgi:hypothetical protein